ncbi:MAG: hypothetical protein ABL921_04160 [Pirellula sp.]
MEQARNEPARIDFPPAETSKQETEILLIGSADTVLASGTDDVEPVFADIVDQEPIDLTIALRLATASMSHVSPFLWWMAEPTSAFMAEDTSSAASGTNTQGTPESISDIATTSRRTSPERTIRPIVLPPDPTDLEESNVEPPRMVDLDHEQIASPDESSRLTKREVNDVAPSPEAMLSPEAALPSRPAPRKIRLPFEESRSDDVSRSKPSSTSQDRESLEKTPPAPARREVDSQHEQEEPSLDPRTRTVDRELQGVDALNAAKPRSNRREVRIDSVSNKREMPPVQKQSIDPLLANRLQRADQCFNYYLNNPESTSIRSPWAVMHAVLAYGGDYEMVHGNGRVNAIGWMCHNGTCRTQRMFTPRGKGFVPNVGGGVQGHEGQFMAILAQCNVPLDYPIQIGSTKYQVEDLVRYEMATCREKSELTFKLIGLSYYLDSNKQWKASDGKVWSMPKLIQEEMAQPIIGSACGGTHRLMGFSFSIRQRQLQGQPIDGQYSRAAKFVRDYVAYTLQLQNPDGSFSTNWYEGRGNEPKDERKVQTSAHMLEWLMFTMTDEEIKSPKVAKGIDFLLSRIYDNRDYKWPIGPRGHATRAISLYRDRMNDVLQSTGLKVPAMTATRTGPAPIIRK